MAFLLPRFRGRLRRLPSLLMRGTVYTIALLVETSRRGNVDIRFRLAEGIGDLTGFRRDEWQFRAWSGVESVRVPLEEEGHDTPPSLRSAEAGDE